MATAINDDELPDLSYEADLCGNIEQALKALQGYGIMALELIQNADDAKATVLRIDSRDDALAIENNESFSRCSLSKSVCDWARGDVEESDGRRSCNFHAITRMGGRSKLGSENQIGRFGIGFVSVYQVTDTPIVQSVGIEYTLNPLKGKASRKDIALAEGTAFILPWAFEQSPVRDAIHQNVVPADVADKVVEAIAEILPTSVLFLRHLELIQVCRNGDLRASVEIERTEDGVNLLIGPRKIVQRWLVQTRDAADIVDAQKLKSRFPGLRELKRSTLVSIAAPIDVEIEDGLLYAYLPTKKNTGLPLHVNADFFPHASRQDIVLSAESQESFWNQAMLAGAAKIIEERFDLLKTTLGHRQLWKLGEASRLLSSKEPAFAGFWTAFNAAAKITNSVWVLGGSWQRPSNVRYPPLGMSEAQQVSLQSFGLQMMDPSLREHLNALTASGVVPLRVIDVAAALKAADPSSIASTNPHLLQLWSAIDRLLEPPKGSPLVVAVNSPAHLRDLAFLLDWSDKAVSPGSAWRLPENVPSNILKGIAPELPVINPGVLSLPNLSRLIACYDLDAFATWLAGAVPDEKAASFFFEKDNARLRNVYRLLTLFAEPKHPTNAGTILWNTPFLRKADGNFVTPARGLLPGEFTDPTGWFEIVDVSLFPPGMHDFAENELSVIVMPFSKFLSDHLQHAIERGVTLEQYSALLAEIVDHRHELDGVYDALAQVQFVRNRAGEFVRPCDCYFWDASLQTILGPDLSRWVDETWLPADPKRQARLREFFEDKLEMPRRVAAEHIVERIERIAEEATPELAKKQLIPIFRHLTEVWMSLDADYRGALGRLSDIAFLPGQFDGTSDEEKLYRPDDLYRAGRAPGFSTQVRIIDLAPLRENKRAVNELLEVIGVEEEPATSVVVDHLLTCMESGRDPKPLTYQILGQRCEEGDALEEIDRLHGLPCIYFPDQGFLEANKVFWSDPPISRYWHKAHSKMSERQLLFNRLGVEVAPGPVSYAELALELASQRANNSELSVHGRCMRYLAEALWEGWPGAEDAMRRLADEESLLAISGEPIWPGDALWMDSEQHLTPFRRDLDDLVVLPPTDCDIATLRKFYRQLGTPALSEEVRLELARDPGASIEQNATDILRERTSLLLRLAPTSEARAELRCLLQDMTVCLAPSLLTRAELVRAGVTHSSDAVEADAFVDREEAIIYLKGGRVRWVMLARHLFEEIAPLCPAHDIRSLAGTASTVLQASNLEEAEETLDQLQYADTVLDEDNEESTGSSSEFDAWWSDGDDPTNDEDESGESTTASAEDVAALDTQEGTSSDFADGSGSTDRSADAGLTGLSDTPEGNDDPYRSKAKAGDIGEDPEGGGSGSTGGGTAGAHLGRAGFQTGGLDSGKRDPKSRSDRSERRKKRQSRLLSYVSSDDYDSIIREDDEQDEVGEDRADEIGAAAVAAVLAFERHQGRTPEEMPHYNPGYDVVSLDAAGTRRLIEVKGIEEEWSQVGVKLSRRQFRFAQDHPEEFWLYIVEHALDPDKRLVRPLQNPFARVDGYFFDHEWRKACEAATSSKEMLLRIGAKVDDFRWEKGVIIELVGSGIGQYAKVKFKDWGVKAIPVNKLNIVE